MTEQNSILDYFKADKPELYEWLENGVCGDVGADLLRHYEWLQRPPLTEANAPLFEKFGEASTYAIYNGLRQAEFYARLSCMPQEMLTHTIVGIQKLRETRNETYERKKAFFRLEESQAYLRSIEYASRAVIAASMEAIQQLEWMKMIREGKSLPIDDLRRTEFTRFKALFNKHYPPRSPFDSAINSIGRIQSDMADLSIRSNLMSQPRVFGEDQEMVNSCRRYTQVTVKSHVSGELEKLEMMFEDEAAHYDRTARKLFEQLRDERKPDTKVAQFTREGRQSAPKAAVHVADDSNVIHRAFGVDSSGRSAVVDGAPRRR